MLLPLMVFFDSTTQKCKYSQNVKKNTPVGKINKMKIGIQIVNTGR
jgi:hypothetical protein